MNNIVVTGANGFIGKNLVKALLKDNTKKIFKFLRNDSIENLSDILKEADCVYHLAGEVRPDSSDDQFFESNTNLTEKITTILSEQTRKPPIIFTSTVHVIKQKNAYGKTKRAAEVLIEEYASRTGAKSKILRLPHVFGPGCKPNYNSVITTWIYNSIHNLEINVFDRNIEMSYVFVADVTGSLLKAGTGAEEGLYSGGPKVFSTTLGEVVNFLSLIKSGALKSDTNSFFFEKLLETYMSYKESGA